MKRLMGICIWVVMALVGCDTAGIAPVDSPAQQAAPTSTPVPTAPAAARPTYTVQRGTVQEILPFTGRWLPRDQQDLSFEVAGAVRSVNVRRNDSVIAGQVLADLQIDNLEDQLQTALLNLESAEENIESSGEGSEQSIVSAQLSLASARMSYNNTLNSPPTVDLSSSLDAIRQAEEALQDAHDNFNEAVSDPSNPASVVDGALEQIEAAERQLESARRSYAQSAASAGQQINSYQMNLAQSENSLLQAEYNYNRTLEGAGIDPDLIRAVRSAQLSVDQIRADIARSTLTAPFDGIVLEVTIQPGGNVQAYTAVMTLAIPAPLEVISELSFNDTQRLSIGMIGTCQVANRPETKVQCAVRALPLSSRDADQSTRIGAILPDGLALGQLIEIEMPLQTRENVLWLPPQAIRTFQNRTFVVLQTPDGDQVADVTLGLRTDTQVEILSGVEEGQVVIAP